MIDTAEIVERHDRYEAIRRNTAVGDVGMGEALTELVDGLSGWKLHRQLCALAEIDAKAAAASHEEFTRHWAEQFATAGSC